MSLPDINTPDVLTQSPPPPRKLSLWQLWLPLLFQTGIILAAPAQPFYTQLTGRTVILQTVPVDPYDPVRGYSQTLSYDISRIDNLKQLPGWQEVVTTAGSNNDAPVGSLYVTLQAPTSTSNPPAAWQPIRVSRNLPRDLATNQVALKGQFRHNAIAYGLETYYMPEAQRDQINRNITQAQQNPQQQSVVAEVKVDTQGRAVPVSLWVKQQNYRF